MDFSNAQTNAKVSANGEATSRVTLSSLLKLMSLMEQSQLRYGLRFHVALGNSRAPPIPTEVSIKMVMYLLD